MCVQIRNIKTLFLHDKIPFEHFSLVNFSKRKILFLRTSTSFEHFSVIVRFCSRNPHLSVLIHRLSTLLFCRYTTLSIIFLQTNARCKQSCVCVCAALGQALKTMTRLETLNVASTKLQAEGGRLLMAGLLEKEKIMQREIRQLWRQVRVHEFFPPAVCFVVYFFMFVFVCVCLCLFASARCSQNA